MNLEEFEAIDKVKSKMLKYIMYKKRTEREVRKKFTDVEENMLENIIEDLKENGYIDDENYIKRAVNEYMNLKNLSIKEISYKLQSKGINKEDWEKYMSDNMDKLIEYEKLSAQNIYNKKSSSMDEFDIKQYLLRKGYNIESV